MPTAPFAPGSVSLRLYPHNDLEPSGIVAEMCAQAALASASGFDGVMTSEHHGGFRGYLPNPLQAAGWCLESMSDGWAAPSPLLLTLRPPALVAEEIAWLAARFPGRVGLGVAAGALQDDFDIMGVPMDGLTERFAEGVAAVVDMLRGEVEPPLRNDPAIAACAEHPVPIVSAAMGHTAAKRAARLGVGLLFDSLSTPERCAQIVGTYRDAGGTGPCVLIRRAWVGDPPEGRVNEQLDVYRGYASRAAQGHWGENELVGSTDPVEVAEQLAESARSAGADAMNLRIHVPGVAPGDAREQIEKLGGDVIGPLRERLAA
jgi:alkanesulfonate monooxygenase SsuD/methylene tetrahydromethanopterin reductase-like flavin-dependent oxidoreductase (luciferase family)